MCPTHVLWRHKRELCTGRQCVTCQLTYRRPPQVWRATGLLERELHHIDAFIAMSEFSREKHKEFGFPREMEVVPYFLPTDTDDSNSSSSSSSNSNSNSNRDSEAEGPADNSPHHRPYFLFVGRLEKIKGLDDVIPLFQGSGDYDLLIAGDGEYTDALVARAAGAERVKFLGRVKLEALRRYYRHAIALVVPSVCYETFGIIIIESLQQGTPVIARRIGPFPEIVERAGAGELFTTTEELRGILARLAADPNGEQRARLGRTGRLGFERNWSERVVVPQYLDVVRRVAQRKGDTRLQARLGPAPAATLPGAGAIAQGTTA